MDVKTKRPWLAVVLATLGTGLGHLYLRRWRRALGWAAVAVLTAWLFVPESALVAFTAGEEIAVGEMLPMIAIVVVSALDAWMIALVDRAQARERAAGIERCPNCRQQLDDAVDFCPWCATDLARSPDGSDAKQP